MIYDTIRENETEKKLELWQLLFLGKTSKFPAKFESILRYNCRNIKLKVVLLEQVTSKSSHCYRKIFVKHCQSSHMFENLRIEIKPQTMN